MYVNSTAEPDGVEDDEGQYVVINLKYGWKEKIDGELVTVKESNTIDFDIVVENGKFEIFKSYNMLLDMTYTITANRDLGGLEAEDKVVLTNNDVYRPIADKFTSGKSNGLEYRLYEPTIGEGQRPLIVWFHGSGEGKASNMTQILANKGGVGFATDEAQNIFGGAYVLAPQCPDNWSYLYGNDYTDQAIALIKEIIANNNIDPNRVIIAGCSAGGKMTWNTLLKEPDMFAAAVPICAEVPVKEDLETVLEAVKDVPIWLVHSEDDGTVPVENSRQNYKVLKELGGNITYTEYKNVMGYDQGTGLTHNYSGHWSWVYALNNDPVNDEGVSLFGWIAKQNLADRKVESNTPVQSENPTQSSTNTTVKSPETGDETHIILPVSLLTLSVASGYMSLRRRKEY